MMTSAKFFYKTFLYLTIFLGMSSVAFAATKPGLNFSDLIDGPKSGIGDNLGEGAIVTIWGNNLGSSKDTSAVYIKDSAGISREAAYVYYWCDADGGTSGGGPSDLYTYHRMQEIAFSIPSASADGPAKIYVTVNGKDSNELDFYIRSTGRFWFVKSNGSDSNSGSFSAPKLDLEKLTQDNSGKIIASGDIIYVLGDYTFSESDGLFIGASGSALSGSANSNMGLISYPGAHVKVISTDTRSPISNYSSKQYYWVISKMETEGHVGGITGFAFGRIVGNNIHGDGSTPTGSGALIDAGANFQISTGYNNIDSLKVFGNYIHDFGTPAASNNLLHTTYFRIRSNTRTLHAPEIGWNYLHDPDGPRFGIHYYDEGSDSDGEPCVGTFVDTFKIHHNVVKDQTGPGINIGTLNSSVEPKADFDVDIYNNLLINCGNAFGSGNTQAVQIYGARMTGHMRFYNNTIYGFGEPGKSGTAIVVPITSSNGGGFGGTWEYVNNIVVDTNDFSFDSTDNTVTPTVRSKNIWYNGGDSVPSSAPSWDTPWTKQTHAPEFIDPANGDFRLTLDSPARDTGADVSDVLVNDLLGVQKAGGYKNDSKYDIGAFEYQVPQTTITNMVEKKSTN